MIQLLFTGVNVMLSQGDCRFIGSVVSLEGDGAARVERVKEDKIFVRKLDGSSKECYYEDIQFVWMP